MPRVPHDLETICLKCLEKEPARRYQTAQELADELSRFLRDEPILARPTSRLEKAWRWCRRKPALASLGASVILVFTLGFAGTLWQWRQAVHNALAEAKQRQRADENRERVPKPLRRRYEIGAGRMGRGRPRPRPCSTGSAPAPRR